jgi:FkbM family methyltransferase
MRRQETAPIGLQAHIAVELRCPPAMEGHLAHVLEGEYESGYAGENLRVLDIGANAGAFSIWAAHRWPGSTIDAYEPGPGTFQLLQANTRFYPMVRCHNVAVYPSEGKDLAFTSRYTGDGEAGVVEVISEIFGQGNSDGREFFQVPALHPRELPPADVIKIDTEGAEAKILEYANLSNASLLLIEYHFLRHLRAIKTQLGSEFVPIVENQAAYADIMLGNPEYRPSLAGEYYGLLFLLRRGQTRLRRLQPPTQTNAIETKSASQLRRLAKSLLPPALVTALRKAREFH